ncbi:extracellular solute-binding protein [Corynebacterium poyangense]|uniref:Extracellular solute-binding protein n=1 Tax=Corynebacterium poyangense TaxID=2684405 RepID=A0A7H0SMH4_9CORY|nr:ABC transporter substrate-binding protein [Corynebacterium poyangense]MBZ8176852.1 extracellular solute-binding protein [Corynebacterium poyangense]QNQ89749.1 extracellular solute-binding protein [Corynebacterium poyangense]
MSSRLTRKTGAVLAASVVAGSLILSGCSSSSSDSTQTPTVNNTDGRGPITFAMGKNDIDLVKPIVESWNSQHADEKVTLHELAGEADDQRDTLVQSLQAGNSEYDVMALDVVWTADFAAHQWLAPLTGDLQVDTSGLLPATVKSATYNGTLYALPQNTNGQLLFRNKDLVEHQPENWTQLKQDCDSRQGEKKSKDCLTLQLKQYEGLTVNTADFMEGWGGSILNEDGSPNVESQGSKDGLQAMVDGLKDNTIAKGSLSATEEETNQAFVGGDTAFAVNWPYMYTNAVKAGIPVEVQPLVGKDGVGVSTLGGYNNGININSEHKATARDFIKFIINEDNQRSFADNSFPPVLSSIYDDAELVKKYPYLPALKLSLENAVPRPVSPFYTAISKAIQDNAYAALTAGRSVDDATKDMSAAITNAAG